MRAQVQSYEARKKESDKLSEKEKKDLEKNSNFGWEVKEPKVCYAELNRGASPEDQIGIGFPCIFDKQSRFVAISLITEKEATEKEPYPGALKRIQTRLRCLQSRKRS